MTHCDAPPDLDAAVARIWHTCGGRTHCEYTGGCDEFQPVFVLQRNCAEAFQRYQEIFGGELHVMTNADVPEGVEQMPDAKPDLVMHAALMVGDGLLMGSDDPTGDDGPKVGSAVAFTAPDGARAKQVFEALGEGGETTMPFGETFFSKGFGMCTDRFGVPWMVDTAERPDAG